MPPVPAAPALVPARDRIARLSIVAGLVACAAGVVAYRLWTEIPWGRCLELAAIAGLVAVAAWGLVRWRGLRWATALALTWTALVATMAGPVPALAAVVFGMGALALGSVVADADAPMAFVLGAGLMAGLLGWLLPLPLHHPFTYAPALLGVLAWRRDAVRRQLKALDAGWRRAVDADPRAAAWAVSALGIASTGTWLPTLQYDDLAYHLGLPWQLMLHGRYVLDPTHQVSALAPWAGDVLQAVPQVIAGAEARGAVNGLWLVATAALLWRISRCVGLGVHARWTVLALLGSLPLFPALLAGMQTELPATAATLALATLACAPFPATRRHVYAAAVLCGFLLGLKLTHPFAASALALAAAWRLREAMGRRPLDILGAVVVATGVAGSSYAYAQAVAGNPVLPFFNATFRSPFFPPVDFHDPRWQGDGMLSFWHLTFDTSRYLEAWDGGFGFVQVALGGAMLAALRERRTRLLAACGLVAFLLPLAAVPYARYAFAGIVLLLPVAAHAVFSNFGRTTATRVVLAVALLDFAFLPNSHWLLHAGGPKRVLLAGGRDEPVMERYAPERVVHARIRESARASRVLDMHGATHAELAGAGRTSSWYAPRLHAASTAADRDASGEAWARLLVSERVTDVVLRPSRLEAAQKAGLARRGAYRALTVGDVEWWRIPVQGAR